MKTGGLNVLLVFPDQWRPDWTPANPQVPLPLPNLKRLLAEGTHFNHAITSSPLCAPSRACFALGLDYQSCPVKANADNLPLNLPTFYAKLRAHGYHVMACGKMDLAKGAADWGVDGTHLMPDGTRKVNEWGFTEAIDNSGKLDGPNAVKVGKYCPYTHFLQDHQLLQTHLDDFKKRQGANSYRYTEPTPLPDFAYCDNFEGNVACELIRKVPAGENWFLQVNFSGPHDPVDVTKDMWTSVQGADFPAPIQGDPTFTAQQHNETRRCYAAMQENIDAWLGKFRVLIEERGETSKTVIIFASDHGEMLGDHDRWGKSIPFHASMGIPMVIAGPGLKAGAQNDSPVTLLDLAATILDLSASGDSAGFGHGHSLVPILKGEAESVRQIAVSGLEDWRAAYDGRWKLVRGFDPARKGNQSGVQTVLLFDRQSDPDELTNVFDQHPEMVARLAPYLDKSPDA
jgi:arylsulfatase A-like enzyme